ncbi:MAG TPA: helix-turn-helix domain-containing protein [Planctomycetota bacterium]|nr:helix-turn-helix domain-containing protein [Planctomycetota bacterium]
MGTKYHKNGKNGRLTAQERRLVNRRLKVIKLAKKLGSVSDACRICRMNRSLFYRYKRRYEKYGMKGLRNLPTTPHHSPRSVKPEVKHKILFLAMKNTQCGCRPIADMIASQGHPISHETVRNYLKEKGLNTIAERQILASQRQDKLIFI